ncbi:MAG TPA: CpsB/CapC family capsule biosynthesis tyrosine phosphatase [Clostridia bacterium]|nr:CpsB/CapC family capsule biosynthesis tyrosine phosphatase [Clostridia bacterium]
MGMVDIHCHILPAVDDGSKSWEMSVEMCRVAVADGTSHIVATPHCNDRYVYDRESHLATLRALRERSGNMLELSLGCDFHFSYENVQDALKHPERYTIADTRYLLVEFSDYTIAPATVNVLGKVCDFGLTPIITHPERNLILQKHPETLLKWIDLGCIVQITANSLTGYWGSTPKKVARWLLKKNAVHVIASDAHAPTGRDPVLSQGRSAAAEICGSEIATALVAGNPQAIVRGEALPYVP